MASSPSTILPSPLNGRVDLLIIAGEHSGDQHAASMVRSLLAREPSLQIAALGGPELAAAGAHLLHDLTASSVVGFVEVLPKIPYFRALHQNTLAWIREYRPRAVCFVDYPGFNLRLAADLKKKGLSRKGGGSVSTLFYISPQIWAWKAGRRFKMAGTLDALAVIFPFEVDCYKDTTLEATFVGHPFLAPSYQAPVHYDPQGPILLLPGSRRGPVKRIFPDLQKAYAAFEPKGAALVIHPSEAVREVLIACKPEEGIQLQATGQTVGASAVLTSSGTMSMHCALAGIPGALVYRTNPITYFFGRLLVKTPYIGIANLLLNKPMYPEFIQGAARPDVLAEQLRLCLGDPERLKATQADALRLREILHQPAEGSAADWVLQHLD